MEKRSNLRSLIASVLLVAMVLAAPLMLTQSDGADVPADNIPTVELNGMRLGLDHNGNIKAYVDVYLKGVSHAGGVELFLRYNPEWLQPSDYTTNDLVNANGEGLQEIRDEYANSDFFVYNPELYVKTLADGTVVRENPFQSRARGGEYYRRLDTANSLISLKLYLDIDKNGKLYRDFLAQDNGDLTITGSVLRSEQYWGEQDHEEELFYYFGEYEYDEDGNILIDDENGYMKIKDAEDTRVLLGTLSFRVTDRAALRAMVEGYKGAKYWYGTSQITPTVENGVITEIPPMYADASIDTDKSNLHNTVYSYPWYIWGYQDTGSENMLYNPTTYSVPDSAAAEIYYDFGDGLVAAELLQPEVEINAYRAYSFSSDDPIEMAKQNVAAALRKYSPTVVASYADAHINNFTMNWGMAEDDPAHPKYEYRVYAPYTGADAETLLEAVRTNRNDPAYSKYLVHTEVSYSYTYDPTTNEVTSVTTHYNYSLWQDIETINNFKYDPRQGEYIATQYFWYDSGERTQDTGEIVYYRYPNPLEAHLKITPVHVTGVTAANLDKRYIARGGSGTAVSIKTTHDLELPGEVRILTKEVSGAPSLFLSVRAESGDLPEWKPSTTDMSELVPEGVANASVKHWPVDDDSTPGDGDYIFTIGDKIDGEGETKVARPVYGEDDIRAKYPWLTADDDYPIQAVRTVLPESTTSMYSYNVIHVRTNATPYLQDMEDYTRDRLSLVLGVRRNETRSDFADGEADAANFSNKAAFRIKMPNGREIMLGVKDENGFVMQNWFEGTGAGGDNQDSASYETGVESVAFGMGVGTVNAETLTLIPGCTSDAAVETLTAADRADLRRMINLGGYFEIAVCEDNTKANPYWSEFMPVYVTPRNNYYEENKEYNFIGLNAGLVDYRGRLSTTMTLPNGKYTPVAISGANPNTFLDTDEDYGVLTTYDGATGEQPGRTYTFRVEPNNLGRWDVAAEDSTFPAVFGNVSKYNSTGDNDFEDMVYDGYGLVKNDQVISGDTVEREPVLRFSEPEDPEIPIESLHLIYNGDEVLNVLTTPRGKYNEVTDTKFNTQTEGYVVRQSFVLTLLNDGDTDIDGIYIDTLTDDLPIGADDRYWDDGGGGHFEITDPPASFLAAGCSTDFTVTYVFDLRAQTNGEPLDYLDKLYVCSNRSGVTNRLCEFDAHFTVTNKPVNRVTVVVLPTFHTDPDDPNSPLFTLGAAGVIGGMTDNGDGTYSMDYNYASSMRTAEETVYIGTFPYEEYEVLTVISSQNGVEVVPAKKGNTGDTWDNAWEFKMPPNDVTIYVIFDEPPLSKLRPKEINVYASGDQDEVCSRDPVDRDNTRKVLWEKSFTPAEIAAVTTVDGTTHKNVINDIALMTGGRAAKKDYNSTNAHYLVERDDGKGYDTIVGNAHYLVVLEKEEEYVQADVLLRKVVALTTGENAELIKQQLLQIGFDGYDTYKNLNIANIDITMDVYRQDKNDPGSYVVEPVYAPDGDIGDDKRDGKANDYNKGDTEQESKHTSKVFLAPDESEREWLVIQLSYFQTESDPSSRVTRGYYIELVRRPSYSVVMNYGNSPVGMIYNTKAFHIDDNDNTKTIEGLNAAGAGTLELFEKTRSFAEATDLPYAYTNVGRTPTIDRNLVYNREAWVPQGMLYDSDSLTSVDTYSIGRDKDGAAVAAADVHKTKPGATEGSIIEYLDFDAVEEYLDLDLDPYSLFVLLGEDFTDPGLSSITDSSMRVVEHSRVHRYIKDAVLLNDDENATQLERFAGVLVTPEGGGTPTLRTADIDLGTLDDSPYQAWQKWQATHRYSQQRYPYNGHDYDMFYDPETYDADNDVPMAGVTAEELIFYFEYNGNYYECETHERLLDEEILERLEAKYTDDPQSVLIRPGVYELVYEFEDFDSVVDPDREPLRETRCIVVLGTIGDVNADNFSADDALFTAGRAETNEEVPTPSASDETLIEKRVAAPLGYDTPNYKDSNVVKFRTADVNNDRNVNNVDANALHAAEEKTGYKTKMLQFYAPVDYSNTVTATTMEMEGGASNEG